MNKVKPLSLRETTLKEEMKSRCLQKGQYIDENAKEKFDMLCHLEDFEIQCFELQNQVEKLTQENNDLEERVIHQDNLIYHLETWIKKQIEECNNYSKYIEKKVSELKARSSGKTYIANEIMKNEVAKKVIQEFLDKLNEIRSKNDN